MVAAVSQVAAKDLGVHMNPSLDRKVLSGQIISTPGECQ